MPIAKMLMEFAEDYTRIFMNVKQELVLLSTSNNTNAVVTRDSNTIKPNGTLKLTKICWKQPYVHVADAYRLSLL